MLQIIVDRKGKGLLGRDLQLNALADFLRSLAHFPQSDSQVLRSVGVQKHHLAGPLLADPLLAHGQFNGRALRLRLKHLLELINVKVLKMRERIGWVNERKRKWNW